MLDGQFLWGAILLKSNGGIDQGWLSRDGNSGDSVKAKASFIAREASRAIAKAELSDPMRHCRRRKDTGQKLP